MVPLSAMRSFMISSTPPSSSYSSSSDWQFPLLENYCLHCCAVICCVLGMRCHASYSALLTLVHLPKPLSQEHHQQHRHLPPWCNNIDVPRTITIPLPNYYLHCSFWSDELVIVSLQFAVSRSFKLGHLQGFWVCSQMSFVCHDIVSKTIQLNHPSIIVIGMVEKIMFEQMCSVAAKKKSSKSIFSFSARTSSHHCWMIVAL